MKKLSAMPASIVPVLLGAAVLLVLTVLLQELGIQGAGRQEKGTQMGPEKGMTEGGTNPLAQYVLAEDGAYRWEKGAQRDLLAGAVGHELELTSQVWQDIPWQHRLRVILPRELEKNPTHALLIITGSGQGENELRYGALMAGVTRAPVAILHDVPNQPLLGGLREDDLIAETFLKFAETEDPNWLLLLPMVKSAVKAMDAVAEFVEQERGTPVAGFVVTGGSKRGWTTWLTPVVDPRVKAIAPIAYDNLDLSRQMAHQREVWGDFSEKIAPYTEREIPQRLLAGEEIWAELAAIVDPFAYRRQITLPKLIIVGTNDRYWPLDTLNLYVDELAGETYVFYVPNAGHDLDDGIVQAIEDVVAFFLKTDGRLRFPTLDGAIAEEAGTIRLTVTSDISPEAVRAWVATSPDRDFRDAHWEAHEMQKADGKYVYPLQKPATGYVALFGEAVYVEAGRQFALSTRVRIFQSGASE